MADSMTTLQVKVQANIVLHLPTITTVYQTLLLCTLSDGEQAIVLRAVRSNIAAHIISMMGTCYHIYLRTTHTHHATKTHIYM